MADVYNWKSPPKQPQSMNVKPKQSVDTSKQLMTKLPTQPQSMNIKPKTTTTTTKKSSGGGGGGSYNPPSSSSSSNNNQDVTLQPATQNLIQQRADNSYNKATSDPSYMAKQSLFGGMPTIGAMSLAPNPLQAQQKAAYTGGYYGGEYQSIQEISRMEKNPNATQSDYDKANARIAKAQQIGSSVALGNVVAKQNKRAKELDAAYNPPIIFNSNVMKDIYGNSRTSQARKENATAYYDKKAKEAGGSAPSLPIMESIQLGFNAAGKEKGFVNKAGAYLAAPIVAFSPNFANTKKDIKTTGYQAASSVINTGYNVMRPDIGIKNNPVTFGLGLGYGALQLTPYGKVASPFIDKAFAVGLGADVLLTKKENQFKEVGNIAAQTPIFAAGALSVGAGAVVYQGGKKFGGDFISELGGKKQPEPSYTFASVSAQTIRPELTSSGTFGGRLLTKVEMQQIRMPEVLNTGKKTGSVELFGMKGKKAELSIGRSQGGEMGNWQGSRPEVFREPEALPVTRETPKVVDEVGRTTVKYNIDISTGGNSRTKPNLDFFGKPRVGATGSWKTIQNTRAKMDTLNPSLPSTLFESGSNSIGGAKAPSSSLPSAFTDAGSFGVPDNTPNTIFTPVSTPQSTTTPDTTGFSVGFPDFTPNIDTGTPSKPMFPNFGGGGDFGFDMPTRKKKRKYKYQPSIFSIITKAKPRNDRAPVFSGLSIRPVLRIR